MTSAETGWPLLDDRAAELRDLAADARDALAADRDAAAARRDPDPDADARDRDLSAQDREEAASDRRAAARDRSRAGVDPLTGALRRDHGQQVLSTEIARARRGRGTLVLGFVDVDGLKMINDTRGYAAGDAVLHDVATTLTTCLRSYDLVVRQGGDEFLLVLPDTTLEHARGRLEEIDRRLAECNSSASITVGLVALEESADDDRGALLEVIDPDCGLGPLRHPELTVTVTDVDRSWARLPHGNQESGVGDRTAVGEPERDG